MKRFLHLTVATAALLAAGAAQAQIHRIDGAPLRIDLVGERGELSVYRLQGSSYVRQYFSRFHSVLFLGAQRYCTTRWSPTYFTPVSSSMPDSWTIVCVVDAGTTGVRLTQTISYVNGQMYFTKNWVIENLGSSSFPGVRFLHGGDTYFAGDDSSQGHWDPVLKMVYLTNPNPSLTGIMGYYASAMSPSTHYYEDGYWVVYDAMSGGANLPDTVNPNYLDAGYALQWDRATLMPGDRWEITAYEKWTEAGFVQVFAPANQQAGPGDVVPAVFTVQNYQADPDMFDLAAAATGGWTTDLPMGNTVLIPSGGTTQITVNVTVPAGALPGAFSDVTLTATSQSTPGVSNSDTTRIDIPGGGAMKDVSASVGTSFTSWALDRNTGLVIGTLQLQNNGSLLLTQPFWYAVQPSPEYQLMNPTGTLPDGTPYLDITAQVHAALPGVGNGDLTLNPGETVAIPGITFYSRARTPPAGFVFSVWADPPQFDANMDGAIDDGEVLAAVAAWRAGTIDDAELFATVRLWKRSP